MRSGLMVLLACALLFMFTPLRRASAQEDRPSDVRCGSYCLFVALRALDLGPAEFEELEASIGPPPTDGYSMLELQQESEKHGASTLAVQTTFENLRKRATQERFHCIAYLDTNKHFVLLQDYDTEDSSVAVIDPPRSYTMPAGTLETLWSGDALLLSDSELTPEEDLPSGFGVIVGVALAVTGAGLVVGLVTVARRRRNA